MRVIWKDGLPCVSSHVRVEGLHPVLYDRLIAFLQDPSIRSAKSPRIAIVSGVRTDAEQRQLYRCWKEKERRIKAGQPLGSYSRYNLAANPDRPWGGQSGPNIGRGSRHQSQQDGYGYAIDFRLEKGLTWNTVWSTAKGYGLLFPLSNNKSYPEPWHCVPIIGNDLNSWCPSPKMGGKNSVFYNVETIARNLAQGGADVSRTMLRKGARGDAVKAVQSRLHDLGWAQPKDIDGIYGPKTFQIVRGFQTAAGLTVDGVVGPKTWTALMDDNAPRMPLLRIPRYVKKTQPKPRTKHKPYRGLGVVPHQYRGVPPQYQRRNWR